MLSRRVLLLSAALTTATAITLTTTNATMNAQSSGPSSLVDAAFRANTRTFRAYLVFLLLAGIGTAYFTFKVKDSDGQVQDAIRADANARIKKVESDGERAKEQSEKDISTLKLALSKQEQETAEAKRALWEIQERIGDRRFTDEQLIRLTDRLLSIPKPRPNVQLTFVDQGEPKRFAEYLVAVFNACEWHAEIVRWSSAGALINGGVWIESRVGDEHANDLARIIGAALTAVGVRAMTGQAPAETAGFPVDALLIRVGPKIQ
jgi:hypothetical protein